MLAKNTFGCPFFSFGRSPAHIANRRFAYVCSRKRLPTARYQTEQSDLDPEQNTAIDYDTAEETFKVMLRALALDQKVLESHSPERAQLMVVEAAVGAAQAVAWSSSAITNKGLASMPGRMLHSNGALIDAAAAAAAAGTIASNTFGTEGGSVYTGLSARDAAHLFLQRILYRINRLNHFWFDDLDNYINERSLVIAALCCSIEDAWAEWESLQFGPDRIKAFQKMTVDEVKAELEQRYTRDVDPPQSALGAYIANDMQIEGYKQLLAMASLDGLTEASRQSRVCAGAANQVSNAVFRVLIEEYGSGNLSKKHSTFFASMMRELGLSEQPEEYLDAVPWQALAGTNHNFLLTETRRGYLRYMGGLTYFEIVGPAIYRNYLAAAKRLGLAESASSYWALHIKEDERHGKWMLQDAAVPLAEMYPEQAWQILQGYDQEVFMSSRAAGKILESLRQADEEGFRI